MTRHRIVIALEASDHAPVVIERALAATRHHIAVALHFVTVTAAPCADVKTVIRGLGRQVLGGIDNVTGYPGDVEIHVHVRSGDRVKEIIRLAGEVDAGLIVCGRESNAPWRYSIATDLVEASPCPTLVVGLANHTPVRAKPAPRSSSQQVHMDIVAGLRYQNAQ